MPLVGLIDPVRLLWSQFIKWHSASVLLVDWAKLMCSETVRDDVRGPIFMLTGIFLVREPIAVLVASKQQLLPKDEKFLTAAYVFFV